MPDTAGLLDRLRRGLPALWLGVLVGVAGIAAPAPFAMLAKADAGRVVGRVLGQEAWLSLGIAVVLLLLERQRARRAAQSGQASVLSGDLLLVLATVFCTVAGYFGVQSALPAARAGLGWLSFGQWHAVSVLFYAIKALLVLALAWRGTRCPPALSVSRPPSS